MKFVYSFQKVLDLKTNEKKQAESELSRSIAAMAEAERRLSELMLEQYRTQEQLVEQAALKYSASGMATAQQYIDYLEEQIQRAKRAILTAEQRVNEHRQLLTDRTVEEKVWIKSRERAYSAFRAESERRAQYEMDEMALMRSRFAQ